MLDRIRPPGPHDASRWAWRAALLAVSAGALVGCRERAPVAPASPGPVTATTAQPATSAEPAASAQPTTVTYDVVLVAADDVLNVRAAPEASAALVHALAPNARGVAATGRDRSVGTARWVELTTPHGPGWANAAYLTPSVAAFAADPRPRALLTTLAAVLTARGDLRPLVSPRGLIVQDYGSERRFAPERLEGLAGSADVSKWNGPACGEACREGTFAAIIGAPLAAVLGKATSEVAIDQVLQGGNASAQQPASWAGFHFISVFDRGTDAADHLDWRSFTLYFEYVDDAPRLVGIVPDVWSP